MAFVHPTGPQAMGASCLQRVLDSSLIHECEPAIDGDNKYVPVAEADNRYRIKTKGALQQLSITRISSPYRRWLIHSTHGTKQTNPS